MAKAVKAVKPPKAAKEKALVATDSRLPLTVALADALAAGKISPELLATRKKELTDLVSEAAKTFGFKSKTSLTQALDLSLGLISLALIDSTKGETVPESWTNRLIAQSWKTLAKDAINLVRTIKEQDSAQAYLFESEKDPRPLRDHLRDFALLRDSHQQWIGYRAFLQYKEQRRHNQATDSLVRLLIKTQVKRPLQWKDSFDGPASADEALNTLLFRACTALGFNQKDIILTEKDFRQARTEYQANPAQWMKGGQNRFDLLMLSVPDELQSAVDGNWFEKHFESGPPKVKKWESEDLPDITGVYYYQTYL